MQPQSTERDDHTPDTGAGSSELTPQPTDATRRPGSQIVGESEGPPEPGTWKPSFTRASLATDPNDPSHNAGRNALIYAAIIIGTIALAALFMLFARN
jgi:hypothetical protein